MSSVVDGTPGAVSCCVILAAGEGLRLSALENGTPKPATQILGLSLSERVMLACADSGVHRFVIVLGSQGRGGASSRRARGGAARGTRSNS